ncbi:MAG: hypothetical protein HZA53_03305 [Planctomycetes bacterium]|nr:hypothetical protein [Planctomycetota bacterium]
MPSRLAFKVLCVVLAASTGAAQWSTDPNVTTVVSDQTRLPLSLSDQIQVQIAADGAGGTWLAWFDHDSGNYDLYVQHFDAQGHETFAHNGMLVSPHPNSMPWVSGSSLQSAPNGDCVIAFGDERAGPDRDIHVYRIDRAGNAVWGANGVTLTSDAQDDVSPRLCRTSDAAFVVAWTRSPSAGDNTVRFQRLDANGAPQFPANGVAITGAPGEDPGYPQIVAAESGAFVLAWNRDARFLLANPRHLHARKFAANGAPIWPAVVSVYDAGQMTPESSSPELASDGNGGAWLAFSAPVSGVSRGFLQRLDANGGELFPHGGVPISGDPGASEFLPAQIVQSSGDVLVAYQDHVAGTLTSSVRVQRVGPAGALMFGPNGVVVAPAGGLYEDDVRAVPDGVGGTIVAWLEYPVGIWQKKVRAQRVDAAGNVLWASGGVAVCSLPSEKWEVDVCIDATGVFRAAWWDLRVDEGDIYAQCLLSNGALAVPSDSVPTCFGDGEDPSVTTPCPCANFGAPGRGCASSFSPGGALLGAHGIVTSDDVVLDASGMNASGSCIFLMGSAVDPGVVFGDGVRCAAGTLTRLRTQPITSGSSSFPDGSVATVTLSARSAAPVGSGIERHYLVYYRNASAGFCPPATFNATNGWRITW